MNTFALESDEAMLLLEYEKSQSVSQVAKVFNRDPSVVSRNLKKLAQKIPVLERSQGKWIVTELGRKFNNWTAQAILGQQEILNQRATLKIASTREFANRYLVKDIHKLFSPDNFHIQILTFEEQSEKLLLNGHVDIVFDCGRPFDPQIAFERPAEEKLSLVVSPEFKRRHKIRQSSDLAKREHIHYTRNSLSQIYRMTKDSLFIAMTFNDIALVRTAVIESLGWAILPTYTVQSELKQKVLTEVEQVRGWSLSTLKFGIWWNRDKAYLKEHVGILSDWLSQQNLN